MTPCVAATSARGRRRGRLAAKEVRNDLNLPGGSSHLGSRIRQVLSLIVSGGSRVDPLITKVIIYLLSGMSHQVARNGIVQFGRLAQEY